MNHPPFQKLVEVLSGCFSKRILSLDEDWRLRLDLADVLSPVGGDATAHVHEAGVVPEPVAADARIARDLFRLDFIRHVPAVVRPPLQEPRASIPV